MVLLGLCETANDAATEQIPKRASRVGRPDDVPTRGVPHEGNVNPNRLINKINNIGALY